MRVHVCVCVSVTGIMVETCIVQHLAIMKQKYGDQMKVRLIIKEQAACGTANTAGVRGAAVRLQSPQEASDISLCLAHLW